MGLFGGSKSKSKTTNVSNDIQKSYADYTQLDSNANQSKLVADISDSKNVDISFLDGGAIKESFAFADNTVSQTLDAQQEALQAIDASSQRETETAMFALNKATTLDGGTFETDKIIKYGAIIITAVIMIYVWRKTNGST